LKKHCDLLGLTIQNAVKDKDPKLLSKDLTGSIGQLVVYVFFFESDQTSESTCYRGIQDTLETVNKEKSKGFWGYVLVEDDTEVLKNANKRLDELVKYFQVCFK
jgi:hypothetical protein